MQVDDEICKSQHLKCTGMLQHDFPNIRQVQVPPTCLLYEPRYIIVNEMGQHQT